MGRGPCWWNDFWIGLTPNRAVLSLNNDQKFNISIKGSYWAPFDFGLRPFYFQIYRKIIGYAGEIVDELQLLDEETVYVSKSKDELDYVITANFTIPLKIGGTHIYTIVGSSDPGFNLTNHLWQCEATFALNIQY